jgi:hypothetical protein
MLAQFLGQEALLVGRQPPRRLPGCRHEDPRKGAELRCRGLTTGTIGTRPGW